MWLVDLNYNFQCDWLIELSDDNLASELVEIGVLFLKPITIEEIVIFMINTRSVISVFVWLFFFKSICRFSLGEEEIE